MNGSALRCLDKVTLQEGLQWLTGRDADLAAIHRRLGAPPLWNRVPGFPTLLHIILEQQVSLASARATFERLGDLASPLTPESLLELDDASLKAAGLSRQKTRYARALARAMLEGELELESLPCLPTETIRLELTRFPGIGNWTADVYLLMVLGRPDIWPVGDLALIISVQRLKGLAKRPTPNEMNAIAEPWRPWRAVAARLLWHDYLNPS